MATVTTLVAFVTPAIDEPVLPPSNKGGNENHQATGLALTRPRIFHRFPRAALNGAGIDLIGTKPDS